MRRRPQELRGAIEEIQDRLAPPDLLAAVERHWREAVGDQVAGEAWPDGERDGRVTVRCRSAVWAAELSMLEQALLERLNERLSGGRQVLGLKFTTAPPRRPSP